MASLAKSMYEKVLALYGHSLLESFNAAFESEYLSTSQSLAMMPLVE